MAQCVNCPFSDWDEFDAAAVLEMLSNIQNLCYAYGTFIDEELRPFMNSVTEQIEDVQDIVDATSDAMHNLYTDIWYLVGEENIKNSAQWFKSLDAFFSMLLNFPLPQMSIDLWVESNFSSFVYDCGFSVVPYYGSDGFNGRVFPGLPGWDVEDYTFESAGVKLFATYHFNQVSSNESDIKESLISLVSWFNSQFGLDDLVKGEPYSLPPSNADTAAIAILGGITSSAVSQTIPIGTFALQVLEQYQVQKLNYVQDVQFQLIIALFKTLIANQWPKGDLSELLASFSGLDTGLEYRARVNDHWLNQSLTRALNSFTDETEYPLDTPSVDKVVAEKTDSFGVAYGNFKKIYPFQVFGAPFVAYLSTDLELMIHSYYQGRW